MNWVSGIVVYLMLFWTTLFMILPWGNRPPDDPEHGVVGSAPAKPRVLEKFIITALISCVLWLAVYVLIANGYIDFQAISQDMIAEDYQ